MPVIRLYLYHGRKDFITNTGTRFGHTIKTKHFEGV